MHFLMQDALPAFGFADLKPSFCKLPLSPLWISTLVLETCQVSAKRVAPTVNPKIQENPSPSGDGRGHGEVVDECSGRERAAEQETLHEVATKRGQGLGLCRCLDSLGDGTKVKAAGNT